MISGAYHDALILAAQVPVGMLFVPSRDGLSHHPDEHTDAADIDRGIEVLTRTLRTLTT
jgi:acetylornithine deacetylase/succinyl-diaminopimelate desuccinylase-like protein